MFYVPIFSSQCEMDESKERLNRMLPDLIKELEIYNYWKRLHAYECCSDIIDDDKYTLLLKLPKGELI